MAWLPNASDDRVHIQEVAKNPVLAQAVIGGQIVLYVHLWVVEGALRKWVPGTENFLYFARDALLILALAYAGLFMRGKLRRAPVLWVAALAVTTFVGMQFMVGLVALPVAAVGLRSYVSPFLLIYAIWCYGGADLCARIAKTVIIYVPLQALIAVTQAVSPPTSWINKQVGSDAAYFVNGSVARASGTFSSPAGLTLFVPLALALVLWVLQSGTRKAKVYAALGLTCLTIVVVVSGSRGSVLAALIVLTAFLVYQALNLSAPALRNMFAIVFFTALVLYLAITAFPDVVASFTNRFENAAMSEDSTDRIAAATFGFLNLPFGLMGDGAGNHSIAGMNLGGSGPWHEIESVKWVAELGLIGWVLAVGRLLMSLGAIALIVATVRKQPLVAILILGAVIPVIAFGQITQFPSAQGFFGICGGLFILSQDLRRIDRQDEFT